MSVLGVLGWCVLFYVSVRLAVYTVVLCRSRANARRKMSMAAWERPQHPEMYGKMTIRADKVLALIDQLRERTGAKVTVTHVVTKALAKAFKMHPSVNARIVLDSYLPYPSVDVGFLCDIGQGKDLSVVKVTNVDEKPLATIAMELTAKSTSVRSAKDADFESARKMIALLPVAVLRYVVGFLGFLNNGLGLAFPPLGLRSLGFGSFMVSSVGMFGIEEGYAPFSPFTHVPAVFLIGAVQEMPAVEAGQVVVQKQFNVCATVDHRICDGATLGRMAQYIKHVLENEPHRLEEDTPAASSSHAHPTAPPTRG